MEGTAPSTEICFSWSFLNLGNRPVATQLIQCCHLNSGMSCRPTGLYSEALKPHCMCCAISTEQIGLKFVIFCQFLCVVVGFTCADYMLSFFKVMKSE